MNLRSLLAYYADLRREEWQLDGEPRAVWSALLPMGGAVSGVAGPNWALIGDAAGCVNPLNGEGIDYGLETGPAARRAARAASPDDLRRRPGPRCCGATTARRSRSPAGSPACSRCRGCCPRPARSGMRSRSLMTLALRVMGNLVTPEDPDALARVWRAAGRLSVRLDERPPFA